MADIKTRDTSKGTIKTINKAAVATERMKKAYVMTKDKAVCLSEKQTEKRSSNSRKQKERICLYSFRKKACFLSAMFPVLWERR